VDEIIFSTDRKKHEEIKSDLKRKAGIPAPLGKTTKAKKSFTFFPVPTIAFHAFNLN
jgi:hypothetical protein